MTTDDLTTGSIIIYPYLWNREQQQGELEGRKPRETVVVSRFQFKNADYLALLAITSKPPLDGILSYELPPMEVRRIGRQDQERLWVVLSEWNIDHANGSFYLEPDCKVGELSKAVYKELHNHFVTGFQTARKIQRFD